MSQKYIPITYRSRRPRESSVAYYAHCRARRRDAHSAVEQDELTRRIARLPSPATSDDELEGYPWTLMEDEAPSIWSLHKGALNITYPPQLSPKSPINTINSYTPTQLSDASCTSIMQTPTTPSQLEYSPISNGPKRLMRPPKVYRKHRAALATSQRVQKTSTRHEPVRTTRSSHERQSGIYKTISRLMQEAQGSQRLLRSSRTAILLELDRFGVPQPQSHPG